MKNKLNDDYVNIEDGFKFYLSENNVWLVDKVPVKYIIFKEQI